MAASRRPVGSAVTLFGAALLVASSVLTWAAGSSAQTSWDANLWGFTMYGVPDRQGWSSFETQEQGEPDTLIEFALPAVLVGVAACALSAVAMLVEPRRLWAHVGFAGIGLGFLGAAFFLHGVVALLGSDGSPTLVGPVVAFIALVACAAGTMISLQGAADTGLNPSSIPTHR